MGQGITIEVDGSPAPIHVGTGHLAIRESVDYFVPTATLSYDDMAATFVSSYPFMQDTGVTLSVDDGETVRAYAFRAFSSAKALEATGVESYRTTLDLISVHASPLLTGGAYHSMEGRASEYVAYIAGECGLSHDVEATKGTGPWINPNWKWAQMVRYLARQSVSVSGSGAYLYFVRPGGELVFRSADSFFAAEAVEMTACSYVRPGGGQEPLENKQLSIRDNHFANVMLGANNLEYTVYDYEAGEAATGRAGHSAYLEKQARYRGVAAPMGADGPSRHGGAVYGAGLPGMAGYAYNKAMRQLEATQVQIMAPLDNKLVPGAAVDLSVPANPVLVPGGVNINYTGRYMVSTAVTVGNTEYMKRLVLVRPGYGLPPDRGQGYV